MHLSSTLQSNTHTHTYTKYWTTAIWLYQCHQKKKKMSVSTHSILKKVPNKPNFCLILYFCVRGCFHIKEGLFFRQQLCHWSCDSFLSELVLNELIWLTERLNDSVDSSKNLCFWMIQFGWVNESMIHSKIVTASAIACWVLCLLKNLLIIIIQTYSSSCHCWPTESLDLVLASLLLYCEFGRTHLVNSFSHAIIGK